MIINTKTCFIKRSIKTDTWVLLVTYNNIPIIWVSTAFYRGVKSAFKNLQERGFLEIQETWFEIYSKGNKGYNKYF